MAVGVFLLGKNLRNKKLKLLVFEMLVWAPLWGFGKAYCPYKGGHLKIKCHHYLHVHILINLPLGTKTYILEIKKAYILKWHYDSTSSLMSSIFTLYWGTTDVFCKKLGSKSFQIFRSYELYHNHSTILLRSSKNQEWLCFNKIWFTKIGHMLDLTRPGFGLLLCTITWMIVFKSRFTYFLKLFSQTLY